MINYLEILRLNHLGYSQRTIETTAHCSRHTVREVLAEMDKHGIQWPLDDDITNADLEQMFFPDKYKSACLYVEPDYPYIHRELAKRGVTLTLLWEEYRRKCYDEGKKRSRTCLRSSARNTVNGPASPRQPCASSTSPETPLRWIGPAIRSPFSIL